MTDAIFLSAGIPDARRSAKFAKSADTVAISAAVTALVYVTLGRRILVWGGQPAITPMIWVVAEGLGVDYGRWVKLYQSKHFADEYPGDNKRFKNITFTEAARDRESSLRAMREKMFSDFNFTAAVFIGGMEGVLDEFAMLRALQPKTKMLPISSTGGAALEVAKQFRGLPADLSEDMDYVAMLHRQLDVSVRETRFNSPEEQPASMDQRFLPPPEPNHS